MTPVRPVALPRSAEHALELDGRPYRVFVAWPSEAAPAAGFPAIYVLDANAAFATVVEAVRMRSHRQDATGVGPAVVIGIAYPGDGPYMRDRRTYDFTRPGQGPTVSDGGDGRPVPAVGGAARFLEWLTHDVAALVGRDHALDPARRALLGHSMGGYFVLDTLVTTPAAFASYIAISPSIWWDRDGLTARATAIAATPARLQARITVGEYEQRLAPWQEGRPPVGTVAERRDDRRMVDHARALAAVLAQGPGASIEFAVLAGEDHASVVPPSIGEGLRFVFAPRRQFGLET